VRLPRPDSDRASLEVKADIARVRDQLNELEAARRRDDLPTMAAAARRAARYADELHRRLDGESGNEVAWFPPMKDRTRHPGVPRLHVGVRRGRERGLVVGLWSGRKTYVASIGRLDRRAG
jgi:hypothetical protein